ncbi:hypothetical protein LAZ67_4002602 [Cordylochernes scorpioides]|uniref:Major facilitator superfamily (MFS) profile domain-containing protein n=1 Tax=Cordylochernes scorpioides TaxID=51811 RepID=A0ABY6KGB6_9ARAC|nr:hypothetical protein LAZ67_4002602 [Cordylochernes scorpioides]
MSGGSWQLTVALCSLANFINAADRSLMPLAIVQISAELGWTLHDQGWVLSAFAVGYMASQLMAAPAVSRYGARGVMAAAVVLWSLSTLATPLAARSLPLVVLCRILLGLGEGLGLPTIFQLLSQRVAVENRSRAFSYLVAAGAVGQAVAAVACPQLPWPSMFAVLGVLGLAWVVLWLCLLPKSPPGGPDSTPLLSKGGEVGWWPLLCHWPLWAIYVAHFSMNWANYMIMHWLPTYLTRSLGADTHALSLTAMPYVVNCLFGIGQFPLHC